MFSVSKISDAGGAHHYFSELDDYYRAGTDEAAGAAQWWGAGAERAGLRGPIDPDHFKAALEGRIAGQQVGQIGRHAAGWDGTFSAPKSVSVAALVGGDRRLIGAHDAAVRDALATLQQHSAMTRQRDAGGGYRFDQTHNLAVGVFRHASNRNREPDLHSHSVIANATFDRDGRAVSLWSRDGLYKAQREAGAVYTNSLANRARALGYDVEWSVNDRGHPSFELTSIPDAARELFAGRTAEIDAELRRMGTDRQHATPAQKQAATLATRKPKAHVPGAELARAWRDHAHAAGFDLGREPPPERTADPFAAAAAADDAVAQATAQLSERDARFTGRELLLESQVYSQGHAPKADLEAAVERAHASGNLIDKPTLIRVPGGDRVEVQGYTTKQGQRIEENMLGHAGTTAELGRGGPRIGETPSNPNAPEAIDAEIAEREKASGWSATDEQRSAIHGALETDSGLTLIQGNAGVGKTSGVLVPIVDHARAGGWEVTAMAPTSDAAGVLGGELGTPSKTVAGYINGRDTDHGRPKLIVVDEASMVSAKDMDALLSKAEREGARVVLTGDEKQIGSVGAGRAFSQLQAEFPEDTYGLGDIRRQRNAALRAAVYDSIRGDAGAALDKVQVREQADREKAVAAIADEYLQSVHDGKETLVVTLSRQDRADVNAAIQQRREAAGEVKDVQDVQTLRDRQWTDAERADASRYRPGDVIQANRKFQNLDRGETATVTNVKDGKVTVARGDGQTWTFDPKQVKSYSVLEPGTTRAGVGDELTAKGNVRATDEHGNAVQLRNGTAMTVTGSRAGGLDVKTKDGKSYSIDTRTGIRADLAYAQTANQAQGKTVDHAIGYMRSGQTNLADQQRQYVTLSRARQSASIHTDDKARLADTIQRNTGRKATALETPERTSRADADHTTARSTAHREPARDRAVRMLHDMDRETRRMAARGERNLRANRARDRAEAVKAARAASKQQRYGAAIQMIDEREKAQKRGIRERYGTFGHVASFAALREKMRAERRAREDREGTKLRFDGKGDSARARKLDSRRMKDLKQDLKDVRRRAKDMKARVRDAHGVLDFGRYSGQRRIDRGARKAEAAIKAQMGYIQSRQAGRKARGAEAKEQARARSRQQKEARAAAKAQAKAQAEARTPEPGRSR